MNGYSEMSCFFSSYLQYFVLLGYVTVLEPKLKGKSWFIFKKLRASKVNYKN